MPILKCHVSVNYIDKCGHKISDVPCVTAFKYASGSLSSPDCLSLKDFSCPICVSKVRSHCWLANYFTSEVPQLWKSEQVIFKNDAGHNCINETNLAQIGKLPEFSMKIETPLSKLCQAELRILRACAMGDHVTVITCQKLLSILRGKSSLPSCKTKVDRTLPCKHMISVECCTFNDPPPLCTETVKDIYTYPCNEHFAFPSKCFELTRLLEQKNPQCNEQITCERFRCGHSVSIPCFLKQTFTVVKHGGKRLDTKKELLIGIYRYDDLDQSRFFKYR